MKDENKEVVLDTNDVMEVEIVFKNNTRLQFCSYKNPEREMIVDQYQETGRDIVYATDVLGNQYLIQKKNINYITMD